MNVRTNSDSREWKEINFRSEADWHKAIDIFRNRIKERFLNPITRIEKCDYAGFAVLALDCLLIEMLQQFREGVIKTPPGGSRSFFVEFLTSTAFGDHFTGRMAGLFYRQIRCGILHQAEIRGSSRILTDTDVPLVGYTDDMKGLIVNRKSFHETLIRVFEEYLRALREPANDVLREKFKKKMIAVCRTACEVV
jgi:hypothetical protein